MRVNLGDITRTHGMSKTPEYKIWIDMRKRCENKNSSGYHKYGARGISVCLSWRNDFPAFYRDIGPRPTPAHSIDRIDVEGNYEPGNCRWATATEQSNNRRSNRIVCFRGQSMTVIEAVRSAGDLVNYYTAICRIKRGWSVERSVALPALHVNYKKMRNGKRTKNPLVAA